LEQSPKILENLLQTAENLLQTAENLLQTAEATPDKPLFHRGLSLVGRDNNK
jgi:hypothetical protein